MCRSVLQGPPPTGEFFILPRGGVRPKDGREGDHNLFNPPRLVVTSVPPIHPAPGGEYALWNQSTHKDIVIASAAWQSRSDKFVRRECDEH